MQQESLTKSGAKHKGVILGALVAILLGAYVLWSTRLSSSPTPTAPSPALTPVKTVAQALEPLTGKVSAEQLLKKLEILEEQMAARFDSLPEEQKYQAGYYRKLIKAGPQASSEDQAMCQQFVQLATYFHRVPGSWEVGLRLWGMFFDLIDFQSQAITTELTEYDDLDERAFAYIVETDPSWVVRNAKQIRQGKSFMGKQIELPGPLQPIFKRWQGIRNTGNAYSGLAHLLCDSYKTDRATSFFNEVMLGVHSLIPNVLGKDWADVGTGSGMLLPLMRQAVGPQAKIYAVEFDPYALELALRLNRQDKPIGVSCLNDSICLAENSVDIITLVGVHMGAGLGQDYQSITLPWLKSMHRALRPGGALVLHEGVIELLDQGCIAKVEAAGFKLKRLLEPGHANSTEPDLSVFVAAFEADK